MANNSFDRTIINARERPMSSDINRLVSESDRALREVLTRLYQSRAAIYPDGAGTPISGFLGDGFGVRPTSPVSLSVLVKSGIGFLYDPVTASDLGGISNVNDLSVWKPMVLNNDVTIALASAPMAPNSRYDIVEVRTNRLVGEPSSRDVLNPTTGVFDPTFVNKSLLWSVDASVGSVVDPALSTAALSLKTGLPGNLPTVPSPTPGYTQLARILVGPSVASVDADAIRRDRRLLLPGSLLQVAALITGISPYNAVTTTSLFAPPSVVATAVWTGNVGGTAIAFDFYVMPGASPSTMYPVASFMGNLTLFQTQVTVDAPLQAILAGVNASPPIKVAIGQKLWKIGLTGITPSPGFPCVAQLQLSMYV